MKRLLIIILLLIAIPAFARMMGAPMGAGIGAGVTVTDHFTYDNGELELKSAGNFVRWETNEDAGTINVATNVLQYIKGVLNSYNAIYAHKDTFASRYVYAQIQITNETGLDTGVAINLQGQGSLTWDGYALCVYLSGVTETIEIYRVTDGSTWLKMGSTDTTTGYAVGDTFRLTHETGDSIKAYKNGVVIAGVGDVDGSPYTAARVGLNLGTGADGTAARSDNWEGGDIR